jgi:hypothetical protein
VIKCIIPRRSTSCYTCETRFNPGHVYFSALQGGTRSDFCDDCWKVNSKNSHDCYWKSAISAKKPQVHSSRSERAFSLFKALEESSESERYILALYLAREKLISMKNEIKKEGRLCHIYESADGEGWIVPVLSLTSQQINTLQQQLAEQLQCNSSLPTS